MRILDLFLINMKEAVGTVFVLCLFVLYLSCLKISFFDMEVELFPLFVH